MFVARLDAATWKVINPNLEDLPNLRKLIKERGIKCVRENEATLITKKVGNEIFLNGRK